MGRQRSNSFRDSCTCGKRALRYPLPVLSLQTAVRWFLAGGQRPAKSHIVYLLEHVFYSEVGKLGPETSHNWGLIQTISRGSKHPGVMTR